MQLEKFDLEKAIHGAKVVTRDGREVTQLTKFETSDIMTLYGVVDGEVYGWDKNGRFDGFDIIDRDNDLFLAVEPKSIWVNVYRRHNYDDIYVGDTRFKSKQDAIKSVGKNDPDYIKTIQITDEL